jgi:hypothetical protein
VVVADYRNKRIQVLDDAFRHILDIVHDDQGEALRYPGCVAVNSRGEIIVSDYQAHKVLVYNGADCAFSRLVPGPGRPGGIAFDDDDNIYVCGGEKHTITVLDKDGKLLRTFGRRSDCARSILDYMPFFVTVCNDHVIVSDAVGDIYQLTMTGSFVNKLKRGNIAQDAKGLVVNSDGDLVIVDARGPITVMREDSVLCRIGQCGQRPWQLHNPWGVALTKTGQIIVANTGQHNLLVYDMNKRFISK